MLYIRRIQLPFCLVICSWLVGVSPFSFSLFWGYAFSLLVYPLLAFLYPRDTLLASGVSLFSLYFFQEILLCIPMLCHNLLGDTSRFFDVSPLRLISLMGYNLASWRIPTPCLNLLRDTLCSFGVSPFIFSVL